MDTGRRELLAEGGLFAAARAVAVAGDLNHAEAIVRDAHLPVAALSRVDPAALAEIADDLLSI